MSNTDTQPAGDSAAFTTTEQVYRAIVECRDANRICTRQVIRDMTGLPLPIVDDRVKFLYSIHKIRRPMNGVYEPEDDLSEERVVSATIMLNGKVKVETGDFLVELSQREARNLGVLLAGLSLQFR
jgi:hypothetical protein